MSLHRLFSWPICSMRCVHTIQRTALRHESPQKLNPRKSGVFMDILSLRNNLPQEKLDIVRNVLPKPFKHAVKVTPTESIIDSDDDLSSKMSEDETSSAEYMQSSSIQKEDNYDSSDNESVKAEGFSSDNKKTSKKPSFESRSSPQYIPRSSTLNSNSATFQLNLPMSNMPSNSIPWSTIQLIRERAGHVISFIIDQADGLEYTLEGGVATVDVTKLKENSGFNFEMSLRLLKTISLLSQESNMDVLVLRGFASTTTSDQTMIIQDKEDTFNHRVITELVADLSYRIASLRTAPFLIINTVEADCRGPSLAFNNACHMTICHEKSQFGYDLKTYGILPMMGTSSTFFDGPTNRLLALKAIAGPVLSSEEAKSLQMVDLITTEAADVFPNAVAYAKEWASYQTDESRLALKTCRLIDEFYTKKAIGHECRDITRALSDGMRVWSGIAHLVQVARTYYPLLVGKGKHHPQADRMQEE
eukprot:TRINITY_DN17450_c0_g1_i1.p1 TRINITY_DN17450_c0_g1~~TRINITY_DN17450_c0_g1_i1.p1  ORF type:complete len:475 (+),score=82.45 TRINITY_DN17450_c0_g1_i1:77-1501(+)